jgi:hypothetical protein
MIHIMAFTWLNIGLNCLHMLYIATSVCNKHFIHGMSTYLAAVSLFLGHLTQSSVTPGHPAQGKFDTKSACSSSYIFHSSAVAGFPGEQISSTNQDTYTNFPLVTIMSTWKQ